MRLTLMPRASSRQPIEAAARPLPSEDTTPPVTKMYFADMSATSLDGLEICAGWARLSIAGSAKGINGVLFRGAIFRYSYHIDKGSLTMNVILFGGTGMVGQGVLRECLLAPDVQRILSIARSPSGQQHPSL